MQPLSRQLEMYRDNTTNLGAAIWTPSAMEVSLSRWFGIVFLTLFGVARAGLGMHVLRGCLDWSYEDWRVRHFFGKEYGVVLWVHFSDHLPSSLAGATAPWLLVYQGICAHPPQTRRTAGVWNVFNTTITLLGAVADLVQVLLGFHKPGYTTADALSPGGIAYHQVAMTIVYAFFMVVMHHYEEYYVACLFGCSFVVIKMLEPKSSLADLPHQDDYTTVQPLLRLFAAFFLMSYAARYHAVWQAESKFKIFRAMCCDVAERILPGSTDAKDGSALADQLWKSTSVLERELKAQFASARKAVRPWQRWANPRTTGYGRFAFTGKMRQKTTDLDKLFQHASIIDPALHAWFGDLLRSLKLTPDAYISAPIKTVKRAIEKCVRCYQRDATCLTDLVRCAIIAQDFEQLISVWDVFRRRMVVGVAPVTRGSGGSDAVFRVTQVKNRLHAKSNHVDAATGYRDLAFNLEVGWRATPGDPSKVEFVKVADWEEYGVDQMIIEVQVCDSVCMCVSVSLGLCLCMYQVFLRFAAVCVGLGLWSVICVPNFSVVILLRQVHLAQMHRLTKEKGLHEAYRAWRDIMAR